MIGRRLPGAEPFEAAIGHAACAQLSRFLVPVPGLARIGMYADGVETAKLDRVERVAHGQCTVGKSGVGGALKEKAR
jgi:hypothetical protein